VKFRIISCAAALLISPAFAADLKPADPAIPLFQIFQALPKGGQRKGEAPQVTFDARHPLLVIWSVQDLKLAPDHKSVLLLLTEKDRQAFAALTRRYNRALLLLEAQGGILEVLQIEQPVENGLLEFSYPDDAAIAQYLRRRFKLAEFKR
jgi:hypothetical protein